MGNDTGWFIGNLKFMKDKEDLIDSIMKFLEIYPGFMSITKEQLERQSVGDLRKTIRKIEGKFEEVE